jgi:small subunit ribosomal protein SAe
MTTNLTKREKDIFRLVQSDCHLGSKNYNVQMKRFIHHLSKEGVPIFKIEETYENIKLAARIIAGVQNSEEVYAISSRNFGQRAVIKFAKYTGCSTNSSSRWTPGSLTNHKTSQFKEPKVIIVADPYADFKPIKEASYANIPVIALCDSHNSLKFIDIVIPCNNNSTESISMIFWMLAREVKVLKGEIDKDDDDWNEVVVDLFYYRNVKELKDQEDALSDQGGNDDEEDSEEGDEGEGQENWDETNN